MFEGLFRAVTTDNYDRFVTRDTDRKANVGIASSRLMLRVIERRDIDRVIEI